MTVFGQKLKELRKEKKMKQKELAQILNVRNTTVSAWEVGDNEPDLATLIRIAKFFNVTTDYLLGLEDEAGYTRNNIVNSFNQNSGTISFKG